MEIRTKERNIRLELSIMLSLASILITPPALCLLPWIWSPTMSGEDWARERFLTVGVHILFIVMNLACVITAFYNGPDRESRQGKTARVLAAIVTLIILPFSIYMLYLFFTSLFPICHVAGC
jgi:hypothetical protein